MSLEQEIFNAAETPHSPDELRPKVRQVNETLFRDTLWLMIWNGALYLQPDRKVVRGWRDCPALRRLT